MLARIGSRVLSAIPALVGTAILVFFMVRLIPGDTVDSLLAEEPNPELEIILRRQLGLDMPIHEQFADWVGRLAQGDLGQSYRTGEHVTEMIAARLPVTIELAIVALIVSLLLAIPVGVLSARRRNSPIDIGARLMALFGLSMPNFWLGILLILVFSVHLRWLPSGGYAPLTDPVEHLRHLVMPAVTLGLALTAVTMRMTRSSMLEVLGQDYVRTARSKGLNETTVAYGHALPNALIPLTTSVGIQTARLLGGSVIVEQVFSWPGIGTMVVQGIVLRDYPVVQACVLLLATISILVNLIVDLLYLVIDPRLREA